MLSGLIVNVRNVVVLALWSVTVPGAVVAEPKQSPVTEQTGQLVVVKTATWHSVTGNLERFEREKGAEWTSAKGAIPVNLGRRGLAWGRGDQSEQKVGPVKREGDGRTPAGVFPLSLVFGRALVLPEGAGGMPYLSVGSTSYCVEDTRSAYYNQIIDAREHPPSTWQKWSSLRRSDGLFDWAVVVGHNVQEPVRGAGSCVFLHIWRGPKIPTSGCTAMARSELEDLVMWLEPTEKPLLVQLPSSVYEQLREPWSLP